MSSNMISICTDAKFVVQEYVRFLQRWQIPSMFHAQLLNSTSDMYTLWVDEHEYVEKTKNTKFVDEESQLTGILSNTKMLIKNLEVSCETNEKLIQANETLLGFVS